MSSYRVLTSSEPTRELSDILASDGDAWTFTEAQEAPVGEVLDDEGENVASAT